MEAEAEAEAAVAAAVYPLLPVFIVPPWARLSTAPPYHVPLPPSTVPLYSLRFRGRSAIPVAFRAASGRQGDCWRLNSPSGPMAVRFILPVLENNYVRMLGVRMLDEYEKRTFLCSKTKYVEAAPFAASSLSSLRETFAP